MQIIFNLLRVIFLLSTIVIVTDCCSSRILLLREQNLEIIHEHNIHITPDHFADSDSLEDAIERFLNQFATLKEEAQNDTDTDAEIKKQINMDIFATLKPINSLDTGQKIITKPTITLPENSTETFPRDCPDDFSTDYCLHGGRCFRYFFDKSEPFYYCECAEGYVGERCEGKHVVGTFIPVPPSELKQEPKVVMARIVFSFPMLLALSVLYIIIGALFVIRCPSQHKYQASGMLDS